MFDPFTAAADKLLEDRMRQSERLTLNIEVEFDYIEGEPASRESPGEHPHYDVLAIKVNGRQLGPCTEAWQLVSEALEDIRKRGE